MTNIGFIRVISLDPGITTGFAIGGILNGYMKIEAGQEKFSHSSLWDFLTVKQPTFIVCERFEFRKGIESAELFSRELIGVVALYSQKHGAKTWMQMPREVINGYFNNDKLKKEKVYRIGQPHANDAIRHLLHWYTFKAGYQFNRKGFE
jgi:hypothetical protein